MKNQLSLFDLPRSFNKAAFRRAIVTHYMRKPGRSYETWLKNVKNYSHPRRFNLVFRSFIKKYVKDFSGSSRIVVESWAGMYLF